MQNTFKKQLHLTSKKIKSVLSIHYEVLILALLSVSTGLIFIFATPLGFGNDEMVHAYKGISLSKGQFFSEKVGEPIKYEDTTYSIYGGVAPGSLSDLATMTAQARGISTCNSERCDKPPEATTQSISETAGRSINEPTNMINFWGANNYIFIPYIPAALGFGIAQIFDTSTATALYLARTMNLLICVALACLAFLIMSRSRFRWVIFAIVLLPSTILSFGLLGVDGMLNSLSLLLLAIVASAFLKNSNGLSKKLKYTAVAVAILLPLIKLPYLLLSLLVLLPGVLNLNKPRRILKYVVILLLIIIPGLAWNYSVSDISKTSSILVNSGDSSPNATEQIQYIIEEPLTFTETFFKTVATYGTLPSVDNLTHQRGLKMPIDLTILSIIPILLATMYASSNFRLTKKLKLTAVIILATSFALICGIFLAMYLTFNSVGNTTIEGIQGRYFIPVYGFIALGIAMLLNIRFGVVSKINKAAFVCIAGCIPVLTAIWYIGIVY